MSLKAICSHAWTNMKSSLDRRRLVMLLATVFLISISCVSCDAKRYGRRPYAKPPPPPVYTVEEQAVLAQFAKDHPQIAKKLIGRNNELAEAIKALNEKNNAFNRKLLEDIGYEADEAARLEPLPESP